MISEKLQILKEVLGNYHQSADETIFYCPKCAHKSRKLSVNIGLDKFQCWVCGYSGHSISKIIKKFGNREQVQQWSRISGITDFSEVQEINFDDDKEEEKESIVQLPKEFCFLGNKNLPISSIDARLYLKIREVDKPDILKWKIGYCSTGKYADRLIFPSFNESGDCNFFVARTYAKSNLKYLNSEAPKNFIFNSLFIDWDSSVVLVEGVFDAIVAGNAVPLLGSSLTEDSRLLHKLCQVKLPVYVALDPDAKDKEMKIINMLLEHNVEVLKVPIEPYKDAGSMSKDEFRSRIDRAYPMNSDSVLERMLLDAF